MKRQKAINIGNQECQILMIKPQTVKGKNANREKGNISILIFFRNMNTIYINLLANIYLGRIN